MKLALVTAAAIFALGTSGSFGADLPAPEVPAMAAAPAAYSWTGFYIGGHVGYGWGGADSSYPGRTEWKMDGVLGGGQVGANWQWNSFVLGLEADISGTGIESGRRGLFPGVSITSNLDYLGTVRGRVGVAFDRLLVYGTGGFAYAGRTVELKGGPDSDSDTSVFHTGWTAGGGVEWAFADNWSAKIEYLYADFDREDYDLRGLYGSDQVAFDTNLVRVGINYKF